MERMFCNSLGYFMADAVLIAFELARGHFPHLWEGRLVHHLIQSVANIPPVFCKGSDGARGIRTYLGMAYLAESSSIFLRAYNILKRKSTSTLFPPASPAFQNGIFKSLLVTFGLSRVLNFIFCTFLIWRFAVLTVTLTLTLTLTLILIHLETPRLHPAASLEVSPRFCGSWLYNEPRLVHKTDWDV